MQCHGGLPGAGSSLHHENSRSIGPNDTVLFGLDRGHDICHLAVSGLTHGVHEGTFACEL